MPKSSSTKPKTIHHRDLNKLHETIKTKTTIMLLHANWCFHCQIFKPVWTRVIERAHAAHFTNHIQFVDIEENVLSTLQKNNETLFKYVSTTTASSDIYFPKIMVFVKQGDRTRKTVYTGSREEDDLFQFFVGKLPKEVQSEYKKSLKAPKKEPKEPKDAQQPVIKKSQKPKKNKLQEEQLDVAFIDQVKKTLGQTHKMSLQGLLQEMMNKYM